MKELNKKKRHFEFRTEIKPIGWHSCCNTNGKKITYVKLDTGMAIKWSDVYELLENLLISEAENDKHNCGIRVNGQFENKLLELRECLQGIENKVKNGIAIYQTRIKTS